jgi:putative Holliday junction resolvase
MTNTETRYLAIDYGETRIGIAMSDPLKIIAYPLITIENDQHWLGHLSNIVLEHSIVLILLGNPVKENGELSQLSGTIEAVKMEIETNLGVRVILVDERYSSKIAERRLIEKTGKKQRQKDKGLIDRNAAAVLLEDYLRVSG